MLKRRTIFFLIAAVAAIIASTLFLSRDTTSPDAKYRAWVRTKDWIYRLNTAEEKWPEPLVRFFRIRYRRADYVEKAQALEADMSRAGYLAEIRINITNLNTQARPILDCLQKGFLPHGRLVQLSIGKDHLLLVCRTNDEALCRHVLNLTNSPPNPEAVSDAPHKN